MLPPPTVPRGPSNVTRRGGYSSSGRGGGKIVRSSTSIQYVHPRSDRSTGSGPASTPKTVAAPYAGRPDQARSQQAQESQAQQHSAQQLQPPSANMITASQEQKGIAHGQPETQKDSDRKSSGEAVDVDQQNEKSALPWDVQAPQEISFEDNRSETPAEVYDRYRAQAEYADRQRDRKDPDFVLGSQETRDLPFNALIEPQELDYMRQNSAYLVDRTRRGLRVRQCAGPPQAQAMAELVTHQTKTPQYARDDPVDAQQDLNEHVEDQSIAGLLRANASATATTPVQDRAQRHPVSGITISPITPDESTKAYRNKGKGTRNQSYESCLPESRRERDELIAAINVNWKYPSRLWPFELTPTSDKRVPNGRGGMTTIRDALEPRDVSTLLLKNMKRFSEVTKGDCELAMKLLKKAVEHRWSKGIEEHKKLLPTDAEEATKLALSKAKIVNEEGDAGASTRKRRAQQAVDDEPQSRQRVRTPDRDDAVFCEQSSPETPSRQLGDQMMADADASANGSCASDHGMGPRTQESLFGPDPPTKSVVGPEHPEPAAISTERQDSAPAASLPSPASESAAEPRHEAVDQDVGITEVRQKDQVNAVAARTISFTAAPDDDWSDIEAETQQLFYLKAKAAREQGKQVVISFGLTP